MFGGETYIEFFVRAAMRFARRIGTGDWPVYKAIVVSSERQTSFIGCILVVIRYKYRNADKRFEGTFKQPFIYDNYADAYLRRYPGGSGLSVRIDPRHPSFSILEEGKIVFTRVE